MGGWHLKSDKLIHDAEVTQTGKESSMGRHEVFIPASVSLRGGV